MLHLSMVDLADQDILPQMWGMTELGITFAR